MKILVKDENDQIITIKKFAFLMNTFKAAADDSQHEAKGVTTLIAEKGFFGGEDKYIPVAFDMPATSDRLGQASIAHKDADLTDVTGRAVNTRIRQQLNIA